MNTKRNTLILSLSFPIILLLSVAQNSYSDQFVQSQTPNADNEITLLEDLKKYLYNLGGDSGYDLNNPVASPSNTLFNPETIDTSTLIAAPTNLKAAEIIAISSMFAALPVNASLLDETLKNFYPSSTNGSSNSNTNGSNRPYTILNQFANTSFPTYNQVSTDKTVTGPGGRSGSGEATTLAVSPLIDQETYQMDPVNQAVLNLIATPDYTFCMNNDATQWLGPTPADCPFKYQNEVVSQVIGALPSADELFSYEYQKNVLSDLNANTLVGPILYDTNSNNSNNTNTWGGLTGNSQADQAANFIRYVTNAVAPYTQISRKQYDSAYATAVTLPAKNDDAGRTAQENAQAALSQYIAGVRVYAAQNSVPIGNLYYILSKRIPIAGLNTSQAANELSMATRRLYDPTKGDPAKTPQWVDMINSASPATVQKEMAVLLSEINYQLYLNRQQEERLLLTQSVSLIISAASGKPTFDTDSTNADNATNTE